MKKQAATDPGKLKSLLLVAAVALLARLPLLGVSLNRDEGAYAYISCAFLNGDFLYRDLVEFKPPLLYLLYLPPACLGEGQPFLMRGIALVYHLAAAIMLFQLARAIFGRQGSLFPPLLFALAASDPSIFGHLVSAEMLMNLFAVASIYVWWRTLEQNSLALAFASGALMGAAALVKQQAIFHLGILALAAFQPAARGRRMLLFGSGLAGAGAVLAVCALALAAFGLFKPALEIYLWAGRHIVAGVPLGESFRGLGMAATGVGRTEWPFFALAILGLAAAGMPARGRRLVIIWTLCGLAAVLIGRRPYQHHLQQLLPPLALAAGAGLGYLMRKRLPFWARVTRLCLLGGAFLSVWQLLPLMTASREIQAGMLYPVNDFLSAEKAAAWLKDNTRPEDPIFIAGSEPEIAWLARRRLAGRYPLMYHLTAQYPGIEAEHERWLKDAFGLSPAAAVYSRNLKSWRDPSSSGRVVDSLRARILERLNSPSWRLAIRIGEFDIYVRK